MVAKLREDVKREILEYLGEVAENGEILRLDRQRVIERFTNETYDQQKISEIIDELEEDELLDSKRTKLELIYPTELRQTIEEEIESLSKPHSVFGVFFVGFVIFGLLLQWDPFFEFIRNESESPTLRTHYLQGGGAAVVSSYFLGKGFMRSYTIIEEHIPLVKRHQYVLYPILAVAFVTSLIVLGFSSYTSQEISLQIILMIITVSVIGGTAIGTWVMED